jgi:predicted NAD/FAD-binding protein
VQVSPTTASATVRSLTASLHEPWHSAGGSRVEVAHADGVDTFDRVVLATHSDTARALRGSDISAEEAAVLDAIPYSYNKVYLHTGAFCGCRFPAVCVSRDWVFER